MAESEFLKTLLGEKLFPSAADDIRHAKAIEPGATEQTSSPAYRLAYDDDDFILRDELRPVRLMLELTKPELGLQEAGIEHTVVMFGSARTPDAEQAQRHCQQAAEDLAVTPDNKTLQKRRRLSERNLRNAAYYEQARRLAKFIATQSGVGAIPKLHVITGGGPGIMEAANRGAYESGQPSIGLNIVLPKEQRPNHYISPELCFRFHYFAMRKLHFLMRAKALVVFPGGFGTLDELFETLTLVQTGKIKPLPILIFGREYWQRLIDFELLVEEGMIDEQDLHWFRYVDTAEEAWGIISRCAPQA